MYSLKQKIILTQRQFQVVSKMRSRPLT